MYRITYEQGNGYRCGCCRRTSTESIDVETPEEIIEWLSELEACNTISQWGDDNDRELIEIREIVDETLTGKFSADPEITKKIIEGRQKAKAEEAEQEKEAELERKRKKLADLKQELGEK